MLRKEQENERWRKQRRDDACSSSSDTASDDANDTDDEGARAKGRGDFLQRRGGAISAGIDWHLHTVNIRRRKEKSRECGPSQGQQLADAVGMGEASGVVMAARFLEHLTVYRAGEGEASSSTSRQCSCPTCRHRSLRTTRKRDDQRRQARHGNSEQRHQWGRLKQQYQRRIS